MSFEAAEALRRWRGSSDAVRPKARAKYLESLAASKHFQWELLHAPHAVDLFDPAIVRGDAMPGHLDGKCWGLSWGWAMQTRRLFLDAADRRRQQREGDPPS